MKKRWILVLLAALLPALPLSAKTLKIALLMAEKKAGDADDQVLGATTAAFVDSRRFEVIERDQLKKIFQERDLIDFIKGSHGDLSDLKGVDIIGVVTFTMEKGTSIEGKPQQQIFIDVRLTDVRTSQVMGSVSSRRPSVLYEPVNYHNAGRLLLENVREMFPPEGSVLQVKNKEVIVSLGALAGIQENDVLIALVDGEVLFDTEGNAYPPMEEVVGELKVVQVAAQMSRCKIKNGAVELGARVRLKGSNKTFMDWAGRALPFLSRKANKEKNH